MKISSPEQFTAGNISKHVSFITFAFAMSVDGAGRKGPNNKFFVSPLRYPRERAQVRFTAAQGKINEK